MLILKNRNSLLPLADFARRYLAIVALAFIMTSQVQAEQIKIAVASNFSQTLASIADSFARISGHEVVLISGSSGKHYAQITHGAPYDAFFSADRATVERLVANGGAEAASSFTYATGKLVVWNPVKNSPTPDAEYLRGQNYRRLAIANPRLAPYGKAAQQVLQNLDVWDEVRPRLVRGENIGQTFQFVNSLNAQLGFIAYSQLVQSGKQVQGSWWDIPLNLYDRIDQQAVMLSDSIAAKQFLAYCRSAPALKIIRDNGYHTPDANT